MPTYRTCIFCNGNDSKPSREDILPQWIAREFPRKDEWTVSRHKRVSSQNIFDPDRTTYIDREYPSRGGGIGLITTKVCTRCNNTWMSKLEGEAKPILKPLMHGETACTLGPDERFTIVRWFIKTLMTYSFLGGHDYFTAGERHSAMQSLSIPKPTMVFLARYKGTQDITTSDMTLDLNAKSTHMDGYSATFLIKYLALQVFSMRWPEDSSLGEGKLTIPGQWSDVSVQIWPAQGVVLWPPRFVLDDDGLDLFIRRWTTIPRSP